MNYKDNKDMINNVTKKDKAFLIKQANNFLIEKWKDENNWRAFVNRHINNSGNFIRIYSFESKTDETEIINF